MSAAFPDLVVSIRDTSASVPKILEYRLKGAWSSLRIRPDPAVPGSEKVISSDVGVTGPSAATALAKIPGCATNVRRVEQGGRARWRQRVEPGNEYGPLGLAVGDWMRAFVVVGKSVEPEVPAT